MVSIIIPTLNEESILEPRLRHLKSCLTILKEIIVFDGHSSDRTVGIAKQYADNVLVYRGEGRQTIAYARNAGAAAAHGDFFVFLDADCAIMNPDAFFHSALSHFEKDASLVALTCWIRVLPELAIGGDRIISHCMNEFWRVMNNVFHIGQAPGEFQMIRRTAFQKVNGFREELVTGEDVDMFHRLSKIGRTFFDPKLVVYHTGRRAHRIGWLKLLSTWSMNTLWFLITGKPRSKEWEPIR